MIVAPTESNILAALRSFLLAVLPAGVDVVAGQPNRVPEPIGTEFVVMSPPSYQRLETNVDTSADVRFVGALLGGVMTVTQAGGVPDATTFGAIKVGATVFGVSVGANTTVLSQTSGTPGGIGSYAVTGTQTVSSEVMASGATQIQQAVECVVQLDFHSANGNGGDMAQVVTTLYRDPFATDQFATQMPNYGVSPLYADDARQAPFQNENQQIEWRWVVDAHLQANQVVNVPTQYSDSVTVDVISVDETYPP